MNIQTMLRNSGNLNLQQVTLNNTQSQNISTQSQQIKSQSQDEYIHEEVIQVKANAVIYTETGRPQNFFIEPPEVVENDSEAVNFNPYTFNPEAIQESKPAEIQPDRTQGQSENGELSEEMPELPPIPEDESGTSELAQDLSQKQNSQTPAKTDESDTNKNMSLKADDSQEKTQSTISVPASDSDDDSDDEEELKKLELERTRLRLNLNTEQDNLKKESLRVELRSVETQINQLKAELSK